MTEKAEFARQREKMVSKQIEKRGIHSQRVLAAMRAVPRHEFVPYEYQKNAYEDRPILIGKKQTISQPYIVALMTQLLELQAEDTVLEIGTGSGYQAAVLAELAGHVYTVAPHQELARNARAVMDTLNIHNVTLHQGDGSEGWPEHAPYNAIMVTAAAPEAPRPLLAQLREGGRLVIPVGGAGAQYLQVWRKKMGKYDHETIVPVSFVPLRGKLGWEEDWVK